MSGSSGDQRVQQRVAVGAGQAQLPVARLASANDRARIVGAELAQ
jgi:hypothetical protein